MDNKVFFPESTPPGRGTPESGQFSLPRGGGLKTALPPAGGAKLYLRPKKGNSVIVEHGYTFW